MAKRANARITEVSSSHVVIYSHPDRVVAIILDAALSANLSWGTYLSVMTDPPEGVDGEDHLRDDLDRFVLLLGGSGGEQFLADDHDQPGERRHDDN